MDASLTIRIENLPVLKGTLVKNVFTYFHHDSETLSFQDFKKLQKDQKPLDVVIITDNTQEEFKSFITQLNDRTVQFLLFKE